MIRESGLHADEAFVDSMRVSDMFCTPMGRLAAPVYMLGVAGAGLAVRRRCRCSAAPELPT